jgi:hypothetical protein
MELLQSIDKISKRENINFAGDFNGRIGNQPISECVGTYGEQITSHNGDIHKFIWEARDTKSITDYVIINDRLKSNIKGTRAFRGSEIDSHHKLVESKFKIFTHAKHSHNKKYKTIYKKPPAFKVHLLEKESIRTLYRNRLKGKLTPLTGEIDADWLKIKEAITKAAEESLGYKKWKNRRWLRTWNDEIQREIKKKKSSHRKYLHWDKFVKTQERDITGTQRRGFKIFKQLQLHERDKLKIGPNHKRNEKNTMENFAMSKVAKVKKEQKRRGEAKGQTTTEI